MSTMSRKSAIRLPLRRFRQTRPLAHFEIRESLQLAVPTGLVVLILSVLIGGDVVQSARVAALLCGNIIAADIWLTVLQKDRRALVGELRSAAVLVGTVAPALLSAVFSYFGQSWISGLILFPAGALLALWIGKTSLIWSSDLKFQEQPQRSDCSYFVWSTLGVAIVIFAWNVAALIFIGLFMLLNVNSLRPKSKPVAIRSFVAKLVSSAGISVSVFKIFGFQSIRWSWSDADLLWDESMAWASQQHFLVENPFYVGEPFHIYQLANLWAGDYSRVLSLGTFEFLSGSGIVIGLLVVLFVAQDLYSILSNERSWFFPIVLVLCAQASFPDDWVLVEALRVPNLLGLGWAIGGTLFYISWIQQRQKALFWLLIAIGISVALTKSPYAINLALFIAGHQLTTRIAKNSNVRGTGGVILVAFFGLTAILASYVLGGPRSTVDLSLGLASIILGLNLLFFRCFGGFAGLDDSGQSRNFAQATVFSTWCVVMIYVVANNDGGFHLMSLQFAICSVSVAAHARRSVLGSTRGLTLRACLPIALIGSVMGVSYWIVRIPILRRGGLLATLFESYSPLLYTIVVIGTCGLLFHQMRGRVKFLSAYVLAALSINFGLYFSHGFRQQIESSLHRVPIRLTSPVNSDQLRIGEWLRKNTPQDSIVASNNICLAGEVGQVTPSREGDCKRRNRESWLSALSHRRQLIEAPLWSQVGERLSADQRARYRLIESFSDMDLQSFFPDLRSEGTDFFVLDKTNSADATLGFVPKCAQRVLKLPSFEIFDIRSCDSESSINPVDL